MAKSKPDPKPLSRNPSGFHLQIETKSAAFNGDQRAGSPAVVSLLRKVCVELGAGKTAGNIVEISGNIVGGWRYERQRD